MKQEKEQEMYKEILESEFKRIRENSTTNSVKIDSKFIKKYYGAVNQAKLGLKALTPFEDALLMNGLAGLDCVDLGLDFSDLSQEEFENFPFDSRTIFSKETIERFHPEQILERGKNFGLGLSKIGLTGKGVHVAIRDQNCNPYLTDANIVEYTKIKEGKTYHEINPEDVEHMHGVTTTSLLASKTCGIAKDSFVHFYSSSSSIDEYVEHIVTHNQKCKEENREEDMILVASGSWGDKAFEAHRDILRKVGCELVCANNFNKNFGEFTNNGGIIQNPLEMSQEKIDKFKEEFPEKKEPIETVTKKDKINIPISRTYHQVGREEGGEPIFKYQSAFSTSWGVPQVAGLLAVFKELDRTLTFDEFLDYADKTAQGEMKIINPEGIRQKVRTKQIENIAMFHDQKSDFDFEMVKSGVHTITKSDVIRVAKKDDVVMEKENAIDSIRTNTRENLLEQDNTQSFEPK